VPPASQAGLLTEQVVVVPASLTPRALPTALLKTTPADPASHPQPEDRH